MIIFKQIRWRNFLSTGNHFTEIDFQKAQTNLIVGTNGTGKSTVLDALTFSLFNKPFRKITKSQLVNAANEKDCEVQIEFSTPNYDWKIVRGIKPNRFEIWKDDELLDQNSAVNDQQKWLEENVLKLNYKSFTQIVVLGSASFVPFMQLSAPNRREVIEDILDIKIFSAMGLILKERVRSTNERIRELTIKKDLTEEKIDMQKSFISDLEETGRKDIDKKKEKLNKIFVGIGTHRQIIEETDKKLKGINDDMESFGNSNKKLRKLGNLKGKLSNKVSNITKEHKFFTDNVTCPTCTQSIEESFRLNKINDVQTKARELKKGFEDLEKSIKTEQDRERHFNNLSKEITKLNHDISQNNTKISGFQRQIRDLESEIQTIAERFKNRNTENEKLTEFKTNLKETMSDLSEVRDEVLHYDFAYSLLKDDGVKTKIIKKYLPFINSQVNRYLQLMDFYINFTLDEEFNETIESPIHEDFSYSSFSEGEKMRIDLALLFTWREVARVKNSVNTNLLIMDEVFDSSLDGFGTDEFMKIIRYIIKGANIFIISHKTELSDKFETVIKFDKIKGFSRKIT